MREMEKVNKGLRLFVALWVAVVMHSCVFAQETYRVAFWNVENLFDVMDDSCRNDDAFTPKGENRWTPSRYKTKC